MKSKAPLAQIFKPEIYGEEEFKKAIHSAMKTSKHAFGLLDITKEFEKYKKFMAENLVSSAIPSDTVFLFRFTYQLKKNVWKEVEIFGDQTFEDLDRCIIKSMGWDNDHLSAFSFPEKISGILRYWFTFYEIGSDGVDNDQYPTLHMEDVLVSSIDYKKHPKLGYVFDFGDGHRFLMEYKSTRPATKEDKRKTFPKIVDQRGIPPEQYPLYE